MDEVFPPTLLLAFKSRSQQGAPMLAALKAELWIQLTGSGVAALYSQRLCKLQAVMCTSITDRRHTGFKNGGAFVILTRREEGRGGQD